MACEVVTFPGGLRAIVCHKRQRRRRCQCGAGASLECDHPVETRNRKPKVGDARLHRKHRVTFYVQAIEGARLEVATVKGRSRQWISVADWLNNASATCDRPICERCAVDVGVDLHLCPGHAKRARLW